MEVQQPDERQPVQHAQQGQQQQHGQQPPQRHSSPLAQPSCAANGSGRACPQPPHSPHAGQEGCSLRACGADEEAAAGEAQPNQGRQPARKRKYEASQLTLQIFEEEVRTVCCSWGLRNGQGDWAWLAWRLPTNPQPAHHGLMAARLRTHPAHRTHRHLSLNVALHLQGCFDMDQNKAAMHLGFGSATMIKKQARLCRTSL